MQQIEARVGFYFHCDTTQMNDDELLRRWGQIKFNLQEQNKYKEI
jgi:hypothetical protein